MLYCFANLPHIFEFSKFLREFNYKFIGYQLLNKPNGMIVHSIWSVTYERWYVKELTSTSLTVVIFDLEENEYYAMMQFEKITKFPWE